MTALACPPTSFLTDPAAATHWIRIPGTAYERPAQIPVACEAGLRVVAYTPLWWADWTLGVVGPFVMLICALYVGRRCWRWFSMDGGPLTSGVESEPKQEAARGDV